jgi:hypothetical protein
MDDFDLDAALDMEQDMMREDEYDGGYEESTQVEGLNPNGDELPSATQVDESSTQQAVKIKSLKDFDTNYNTSLSSKPKVLTAKQLALELQEMRRG